jgi:nitrogen regulatory protein P-II 1
MGFSAVIAVVPPDKEDAVVNAAKGAGATGATVLEARGTGAKEALSFFGLVLEGRYNFIFSVVDEAKVDAVLGAVARAADMTSPGHGIAFSMPVGQAVGLESQLSALGKKPPGAA